MKVVHGTPITPKHLLPGLRGSSFCVSFADDRQLGACRELVAGTDEILILDNGAFTHWRTGRGNIDPVSFWEWSNVARQGLPNAVAVIPDVIGGTPRENDDYIAQVIRGRGLAAFPARTMAIWHLDESLDRLEWLCRRGLEWIGFGSCSEYDVQRRRGAYLERIAEAGAVVAGRARVHLMRGLAVAHEPAAAFAFSADSSNVARNHHRYKITHGAGRARYLADRIASKIHAA